MLEKCGLDDSITLRMLTDAKSQMLVEAIKKSFEHFSERKGFHRPSLKPFVLDGYHELTYESKWCQCRPFLVKCL